MSFNKSKISVIRNQKWMDLLTADHTGENVKGSSLDRKLDQHKRIKHARNGKYMGKYK